MTALLPLKQKSPGLINPGPPQTPKIGLQNCGADFIAQVHRRPGQQQAIISMFIMMVIISDFPPLLSREKRKTVHFRGCGKVAKTLAGMTEDPGALGFMAYSVLCHLSKSWQR